MNVEYHLRIAGVLLLFLVGLNAVLPKRFHWKDELARLSLVNRQIFVVHCMFIGLMLAMMGVLSIVYTDALLQPTPLAIPVLAGLFTFWSVRLFIQWFYYDRKLWVGHPFNTFVHFAFTGLWIYFSTVYGWALYLQFADTGA